jgi:hypothetical protein
VPVLLLQPDGVAHHEALLDLVGPALLASVVLAEGFIKKNTCEKKKKENTTQNKKPAEAGFLSQRSAVVTQTG